MLMWLINLFFIYGYFLFAFVRLSAPLMVWWRDGMMVWCDDVMMWWCDPLQTDALIQQSIRSHFYHSTVLTIAHRLDSIMDSDRIIVMNDGRCAEIDEPIKLLENENSMFHSFALRGGEDNFNRLYQMAKQANKRKQSATISVEWENGCEVVNKLQWQLHCFCWISFYFSPMLY